ncbi:hypothetical protein NMG60_11027231 [Bertholletia excelsa]
MTCYVREEEDNYVAPELKLRVAGDCGEYVKLGDAVEECEAGGCGAQQSPSTNRWWCCFWWWAKVVVLMVLVGLLAAVFLKWIGPFVMDKEIIPVINWERSTFSKSVLGVLLFASMALFPTLLLPSTPSMWVAGMTFGYGFGFLLIICGVAIGISLPYLIGSLFHHKIQGWLEKYPKNASIIRLASEGNWFNQFRAVALIRISPFPYIIYNFCAVATDVKFGPYFLGSLVGMVPEIFVAIYTGILIRTLADASQESRSLSVPQIIFNVLGFCGTLVATVLVTLYGKRRLKKLQELEPLLK